MQTARGHDVWSAPGSTGNWPPVRRTVTSWCATDGGALSIRSLATASVSYAASSAQCCRRGITRRRHADPLLWLTDAAGIDDHRATKEAHYGMVGVPEEKEVGHTGRFDLLFPSHSRAFTSRYP